MHDRRGDVVSAPLAGLRIIESSAFVAMPMAGMTMAQMGADVIRIDRLQGGLDAHRWPVTATGESLFWAGLNKGKRSLAIDFATPEGAEIVAALITAPGPDAGVFLTNLRGRGPLDYPALSATRADLIMVSLTGTRRGEPAVDYTVNPALGFPMATGAPESDPVAHVLPAWDVIAGQMIVNTTLAAERHRLRTGAGQLAELSLKDVAAGVMGHLGIIGEVLVNGVDRPKVGNALYGAYGQDFLCADGSRVMVIGLTDRQWKGVVRVLGMADAIAALQAQLGSDLADEGNRWHARAAITALFAPWFAARTLAEIAPQFDAASLTWSVFRSFAGAVQHDPDLSPDNPMFMAVTQPGIGTFPVPGSPVTSTAHDRLAPRPAPRLGEHSEAILADVLGLPSGTIARLVDRKIVGL
jgi:2-methylfumaryl-CoA isomerase